MNVKGNLLSYIYIKNVIKAFLFSTFAFLAFSQHTDAANLDKSIFYVSNNGSDSYDGTIDAPWRTIQKAADSLKPGDTVYVRGGTYAEFVSITNSGSKEEGYISFKAFPGEIPVLEGENLTIKSGNRALFHLENTHYIILKGFEIRNLSTDDSKKYPTGILVSEGGSNIQLLNNHVHHIKNMSKKGNAHGILFYGNSSQKMSDIKIENNNIHHLTLGSSESLTLSGNIDGFTISRNSIHHNNNIGIDVAGFYDACETNCLDQVRNGTISYNKVYDNSSGKNPVYRGSHSAAGIYADGSTNIEIKNNFIYNNDFGIELASENYGKQTSYISAKNNVVYNNNGAGIIIGGASVSNGGAYKNVVTNNILSFNDQLKEGYGEITVQWNASENQFINNVIYSKNKKNIIQQNDPNENSNLFINNSIYAFEKQPSLTKRITTKIKNIFNEKDDD
ncbi:right-handed parallel beta-helix repeat-containing protein [Psychrobacillus vulpis]|uniref:right-handed parallel beta-helix repeat-containing protein n=1 Tax=Psychrobacillus vulpis TaxID=2325572 RepID=UPI00140D93E7|nr:right-handed parallel beta-helix repeat-containing protein [Psychrobacillus vulpis]